MMFTPRPKGLGKDNFVKLADGEEISGLFKGEIHQFRTHWVSGKTIECPGRETCGVCKTTPDNYPSFRFRTNFITPKMVLGKEEGYTAKIFEGGGKTYDKLTNLDKKYPLESTFVEITRHGLKNATDYSIFPMSQKQPSTEEMDKINAVVLLALKV